MPAKPSAVFRDSQTRHHDWNAIQTRPYWNAIQTRHPKRHAPSDKAGRAICAFFQSASSTCKRILLHHAMPCRLPHLRGNIGAHAGLLSWQRQGRRVGRDACNGTCALADGSFGLRAIRPCACGRAFTWEHSRACLSLHPSISHPPSCDASVAFEHVCTPFPPSRHA
jgi:hypothetical protein